ncbi:DNA helicase-4 [Flavobacterium sp. HSC-32F16]|uniref:UvrD-helicase domain-containing protein n=1 Tax=Flavobacterium sp. HSC-32F16 TaxID=2910964 RepID=UPI0020A45F15|nr:UvrD-helicase domain-containing protein [Flavobacterium sp. HSC-32F16]MCP2028631.1 DNA helicase-4 [Flavobacterium sp. HSC-32F16]
MNYKVYYIIILSILLIYLVKRKQKINKERERVRIAKEKERFEQEKRRLQLADIERLKEKEYVSSLIKKNSNLNKEFDSFLVYKNGYFNNKKIFSWKTIAKSLYTDLVKRNIESLGLDPIVYSEINIFKKKYQQGEKLRKAYNQLFIEIELKECEALFSNIDNASLDKQQRLAIIKDEDNNLVIAGAGSGKTTTVAGKVTYITERLKIKPEEILLITFTKKASDEMKQRIRKKMNIDIEVNTFHSFGRKVIGAVTNDMPSVVEEKKFYSQMKSIFTELMKEPLYAENVIKFVTEYNIETKDVNDFKSHGEYINYIKDNNIKSYKTVEKIINGKTTILRETCKSIEEVKIANYLFLNGVDYIYEADYKFKTSDDKYAQYKPDFYLPKYDIYIEHFGLIDRNNNVPNWFSGSVNLSAKEKYNSDIAWKRETHKNYQTKLIETFSYENNENDLFQKLKSKLEKANVQLKPRSSEEIWEILNSIAKDDVSALDTLINTFLNLFKSNNFEIIKIKMLIDKIIDNSTRLRYFLFLSIFEPILERYNSFLKSNNLIDFNDMINEASNYISKNKFNNKFKYIIIDEFQDTSVGRFNLIKALLDNNKNCKLFAVGDDWQSIYRFTGSDISLFTEFEKYFGFTEFSKIETTYRFNKNMIDLSSKFILANPNQTHKELKPFFTNDTNPLEILYSNSFKNDDPFPLITILKKINDENSIDKFKVKIIALSRYNHFINLYKERRDLFSVTYNENEKNYIITCLAFPNMPIEFLTVHRSKGLQADYVIILNCVSGHYGFPSEQADDPILNLLLSKSDQFKNGEERRLFYVAITRSKRKTFIITNNTYKSKFIDEIDPTYIENPSIKCPKCKLGDKLRKEGISQFGKPYVRYTCSNWNYDCDYIEWNNN